MRKKNINPYRENCTFVDERNNSQIYLDSEDWDCEITKVKGYKDSEGWFCGLTITYNADGTLSSIGTLKPSIEFNFNQSVGLWKYFDNGVIANEIIYII